MFSDDSWLFFKSGVFSYANKLALLVLGFLYTYIIANALGPESYGLAMFVLAFIGNLVYLFGTEPLGNALVVFTPKNKSKKLFLKFAKLLLLGFLFLFLLFFLFPQGIVSVLNKGNTMLFQYAAFLFLIFPFFLLFEALFKGLKSFGKVLKVSVLESFINLSFAAFFVIGLQQGVIGLILAKIISLTLASVLYAYFFHKHKFEEKEIKIIEVKKYVKNVFAVSVMKKINTQIMLTYMGLFLSNALLGLYYMAEKIVSCAIATPIAALSDVMLPFASEKANNKKALSSMVSLNIKFSMILGAILGVAVVLAGRILLTSLFPKYAEAYWLLPFFVAVFLGTGTQFISNAYRSINRTDMLVKVSILIVVITVVIGYFLVSKFSVLGLLFLRILASAVSGAYLYFNQKKVGLEIEIIPRFKDLKFFASVFKRVTKRLLHRFGL